MEPDGEPGDSRRDRQRRRRQRCEQRCDEVSDTCEVINGVRTCASGCGRGGAGGGGEGAGGGRCDGCDCNLSLLRVSTLLFLAAAVVPPRGADRLVRTAVRAYQRWLSRFTPRCPGTPSCSAFALAAVEASGARRGLAAAAARVRGCGSGSAAG
ncbi:membrane protein insertion efficiency factor YidD [Pseudonocardia kunmingensis]|uniref:Hemolytic domain-containing protein n=1 Tax=Pseudonocardia kunmingensis TaxID=630975 RepID=A0A543DYE5_9PSEU|nr:membrane protein insertion efficiency factor YidD [Pseudonocardia kunmingensis]TQM14348.1 hemolytic domain-containing protein [Pseudonocardia kunmingensis]